MLGFGRASWWGRRGGRGGGFRGFWLEFSYFANGNEVVEGTNVCICPVSRSCMFICERRS